MKISDRVERDFSNLSEQEGLSKFLSIPDDKREHFISLVVEIPVSLKEILAINTIRIVQQKPMDIFFIQKFENLHITIADLGKINNLCSSLDKITSDVQTYLREFRAPNNLYEIKLSEAIIARTGINIELISSDHMCELVDQIQKIARVDQMKSINSRSISLVRYLTQNKNAELLKKSLIELQKLDVKFFKKFKVNEICLVRLDKVASYFQRLSKFEL